MRTVRHFAPEPVPGVIDRAIRAGQRAPSASNNQLYSVIQVDDPALRARIADAMVTQDFVRAAPTWLMVCVDWSRQDAVGRALGLPRSSTGRRGGSPGSSTPASSPTISGWR